MSLEKGNVSARPLKLGVLDVCACYLGASPENALWQSIELAPRVEQLGYTRYWLSEHHDPGIAHSSPEIMTAVISGMTDTIRVGSACVLLRHYNPYKVSSTFRLLNTLYPGRIDLGVGAGIAPKLPTGVLPLNGDSYPVQITKLVDSVRSAMAAQPVRVPPPEIWLHGSTGSSVSLAAEAGVCFSLAVFLNYQGKADHRAILENYRAGFKPSAELAEPRCNLAVAGICAETDGQARQLLEHHRGTISMLPTVVGNPRQCKDELERLREQCAVDEIIFLDLCARFEDRLHSYELLAAEIGLKPLEADSQFSEKAAKSPVAV